MTNEIKKYCEGLDCAICDEKEPCIYKIANDLQEKLTVKEQECEELKIYIESNEQQVKEVETLVMDNDRLINELDQLKAENRELKAVHSTNVALSDELFKYKAELEQLKKAEEFDGRYNDLQAEIDCGERMITELKAENEELKDLNTRLDNQRETYWKGYQKLKQTLTEIKELLLKTPTDSQEYCVNAKSVILQKISECEVTNE